MSKKKRLGSDPLERLKENILKDDYINTSILNHVPSSILINEDNAGVIDSSEVSLNDETAVGNKTMPKVGIKKSIDNDVNHKKLSGKVEKGHTGGKFLTFFLAGTEYGISISNVMEIIGLMDIRSIPYMPDFIKGVINLRGSIIPAIDLRLKLGIEPEDYTKESVIIIVKIIDYKMGLIVDRISEVSDIAERDIVPSPEFGSGINTDYILGLSQSEGKVIFFLNIEKLISSEELEQINAKHVKR